MNTSGARNSSDASTVRACGNAVSRGTAEDARAGDCRFFLFFFFFLLTTRGQTEQSASLNQELLIALNGLWSAANNPKLAKKYKKVSAFAPLLVVPDPSIKVLVKIEPLLAKVRIGSVIAISLHLFSQVMWQVREQVQKQVLHKRQTVEVRSDLIKDLTDIDRLISGKK
jgi:hypothetical protein